jgi:tetratricopeptide (TPR) repeat protein
MNLGPTETGHESRSFDWSEVGSGGRAVDASKSKDRGRATEQNREAMMLLISKGDIKARIDECVKELEKSRGDTRLRLKLGDLHLKNRDVKKAIKEYLQAAELCEKEKFGTRAIAIYKRVLSVDPKHIKVLHRVAALYLNGGLLGDAKGCYEKILKIKPDDQEALKALSMIKESQQSKQVQIRNQTEAPPPQILPEVPYTPFDSEDPEIHYDLGLAYKTMEFFDYAIAEFELASQDPLRKFDCYMFLGECFKEKGDFEQSKKYFELASRIEGARFGGAK